MKKFGNKPETHARHETLVDTFKCRHGRNVRLIGTMVLFHTITDNLIFKLQLKQPKSKLWYFQVCEAANRSCSFFRSGLWENKLERHSILNITLGYPTTTVPLHKRQHKDFSLVPQWSCFIGWRIQSKIIPVYWLTDCKHKNKLY